MDALVEEVINLRIENRKQFKFAKNSANDIRKLLFVKFSRAGLNYGSLPIETPKRGRRPNGGHSKRKIRKAMETRSKTAKEKTKLNNRNKEKNKQAANKTKKVTIKSNVTNNSQSDTNNSDDHDDDEHDKRKSSKYIRKRNKSSNKPCKMPNKSGSSCYAHTLVQTFGANDEVVQAMKKVSFYEMKRDIVREIHEYQQLINDFTKEYEKLQSKITTMKKKKNKNKNNSGKLAKLQDEKDEKKRDIALYTDDMDFFQHKYNHFRYFRKFLEAIVVGHGGQHKQMENNVTSIHRNIEFLQRPGNSIHQLTNNDQNDPVEVFDKLLAFHPNSDRYCPFFRLFQAKQETTLDCQETECSRLTSRNEPINVIRAKPYRSRKKENEKVDVQWLLDQYVAPEHLQSFTCTDCNHQNVLKTHSFSKLPKYLAIQLPRWTTNRTKDYTDYIINETLTLIQKNGNNKNNENNENKSDGISFDYELVSIIFHRDNANGFDTFGETNLSGKDNDADIIHPSLKGHYTNSVIRRFNNKNSMYYCNDSSISQCINNNWFQHEQRYNAYFLFYSKVLKP